MSFLDRLDTFLLGPVGRPNNRRQAQVAAGLILGVLTAVIVATAISHHSMGDLLTLIAGWLAIVFLPTMIRVLNRRSSATATESLPSQEDPPSPQSTTGLAAKIIDGDR